MATSEQQTTTGVAERLIAVCAKFYADQGKGLPSELLKRLIEAGASQPAAPAPQPDDLAEIHKLFSSGAPNYNTNLYEVPFECADRIFAILTQPAPRPVVSEGQPRRCLGCHTTTCKGECMLNINRPEPVAAGAPSSPQAQERFIEGKCRYCGEPETQHHLHMCGYDPCKGQGCDKWIIRPQNAFQMCEECLVAALAAERAKSEITHKATSDAMDAWGPLVPLIAKVGENFFVSAAEWAKAERKSRKEVIEAAVEAVFASCEHQGIAYQTCLKIVADVRKRSAPSL